MTVPLVILAICSVGAGLLGLPHSLGGSNRFEKFLEPVFAKEAVVLEHEGSGRTGGRRRAAGRAHRSAGVRADVRLGRRGGAGLVLAQRAYKKADKGYKEPIQRDCAARSTRRSSASGTSTRSTTGSSPGARRSAGVRLGAMGLGEGLWKFDANVIDGTVNGAGWIDAHERHRVELVGQVDYRRPVRERRGHGDAAGVVSRCAWCSGDWCSGTRW